MLVNPVAQNPVAQHLLLPPGLETVKVPLVYILQYCNCVVTGVHQKGPEGAE